METRVSVGFALTQHCNLRCPHCIRDDVTSVAELDVALVLRILAEAREHLGPVLAGFTGGEPMLHREWPRLIEGLRELGVPYTFVSNGWHMRRFVPFMDRYAPYHVRLSLSGADGQTHDEERGRDSFRRVLLATAILTSRRVPVSYAMIIDRRTCHQIEAAFRLGQELGVSAVRYILPQPVPASAERNTDLPPDEWWAVRRELQALAEEGGGGTQLAVDYGAPFLGPEFPCGSKTLERLYVDVHGRLSTCCQLSEYGGNQTDVVAALDSLPFADAYARHVDRIGELVRISRPAGADDPLADFPCLRCARATGKMEWIRNFPDSPWSMAALGGAATATQPLVSIRYSKRARRVVTVPASD
jgi:MoaA/NifB/PqqE/SkfB family radical SAM enzyme